MSEVVLRARGRELRPEDLEVIREIASQRGQTRRSISLAVCEQLGWQQHSGRGAKRTYRGWRIRISTHSRMGISAN